MATVTIDATTEEMGEVAEYIEEDSISQEEADLNESAAQFEEEEGAINENVGEDGDYSGEDYGDGMAVGISAGVKPQEELAMDSAIETATSDFQDTNVIGEPSAPIAAAGGAKLSKWVNAWTRRNMPTSTEPNAQGRTDIEWDAQNRPGFNPGAGAGTSSPIQPTTTGAIYDIISDGDIDGLRDRVESATLDDFDMDANYQPNVSTFDEEVTTLIAALSEQSREAINAIKRGNAEGKMTNKELRQLAKLVREDPAFLGKVLNMPAGSTIPPEEILALRQSRALLLQDLWHKSQNMEDHTPEERDAWRKNAEVTMAIHTRLSGFLTEGGRGSQAMAADMGEGMLPDEKTMEALQQMQNGLDDATIGEMIRATRSPKELDNLMAAVKPSAGMKMYHSIHEVFLNGILSGVKTHMVNMVGGWLKMGMHMTDTAVAARMGVGDNLDPMQKIHVGEAQAQFIGIITGWQEALKTALFTHKTGEAYGGVSKLDEDRYEVKLSSTYWDVNPEGPIAKPLDSFGTFINYPTKQLMAATDAFNKKLAERMKFMQLATRRAQVLGDQYNHTPDEVEANFHDLMENPTEEMKLEARDTALDMTFQTELGESMKRMQKAAQLPVVDKIVPFFKTPTNILKEAYGDRLFFVAPFTEKYKADIAAGGSRAQMAKAKLFNGTAIYGTGIALAASGQITGAFSRDPDIRRAQQSAGMKEYSFITDNADGTKSYNSYQRLEPFSYMFSLPADIYQIREELQYQPFTEDDQTQLDRVMSTAIIALSNSTLDKSWMAGVQQALEVTTGDEASIGWFMKNFLNSHVPYSGMRRDISKLLDDNKRLYESTSEYVWEMATFWNNDAETDVDIIGRERKRDTKLIYWGEEKAEKDVILEENLHLTKLTRNKVIGAFPKRHNGHEFTKKQYHDGFMYSRNEAMMDGMNFRDYVRDVIQSQEYRDLPPTYQAKHLRAITNGFDKMAIKWLTDNDLELDTKLGIYNMRNDIRAKAETDGRSESEVAEEFKQFFRDAK